MRVFTLPEDDRILEDFKFLYKKHKDEYDFLIAYKDGNNHIVFSYDDDFIEDYLFKYENVVEQHGNGLMLFQKVVNQCWPLIGNENLLEDFSE
jgi:hypothetical protein